MYLSMTVIIGRAYTIFQHPKSICGVENPDRELVAWGWHL